MVWLGGQYVPNINHIVFLRFIPIKTPTILSRSLCLLGISSWIWSDCMFLSRTPFRVNSYEIWSLSDCNWTRTCNHLVRKRTFNYLAKLTYWLSVRLQTKWLWVRLQLQPPNAKITPLRDLLLSNLKRIENLSIIHCGLEKLSFNFLNIEVYWKSVTRLI